ncbi:MAG: hypothetical protein JNJ77_01865 [Planctomycetia bacterium]|nr:hypothetical protein [Planctomycetia bacterium]
MRLITCLYGHQIEILPDQMGRRIACPACQLLIVVSPPRPGEPLVPKYEVYCENGHILRVKARYIGTQIKCPQCNGHAWVTTDRLQRYQVTPSTAVARVQPIVAAPLPEPVIPVVEVPTITAEPIPTALADDIPVAQLDHSVHEQHANDDEVSDELVLHKSERRNLSMVNQGLTLFSFSVWGYCGVKMIGAILGFVILLLSQTIPAPTFNQETRQLEGTGMLSFVGGMSDIVTWVYKVCMVLNTMLFFAALFLLMFTPWIMIAPVWFLLSLLGIAGYAGYQLYLSIQAKSLILSSGVIFSSPQQRLGRLLGEGSTEWWQKALWELLFFAIWFFVILGCWQLGKFCRKPQLRQSLIILMLIGLGAWALLYILPLTGLFDPHGTASMWVAAIVNVMLVIGLGLLMIFQHHSLIGQVQYMLSRQRK